MHFDLDAHLAREHRQTPFSAYLREIVYGGNDGIVTTFAIVAGFAGAQSDPTATSIPILTVLLFGLANLFADGLSMSLGSFLSLRADQDVYRSTKAKERHEILHEPQNEFDETVEILTRKGFSHEDAVTIATLYRKNTAYWTEFMMKDELEMPNPENEKPAAIAAATFFAFLGFGSIPLLPYFFRIEETRLLGLSVGFTALALVLLALLRTWVTQRRVAQSILETLLVGGTAALAAYGVGTFFRM